MSEFLRRESAAAAVTATGDDEKDKKRREDMEKAVSKFSSISPLFKKNVIQDGERARERAAVHPSSLPRNESTEEESCQGGTSLSE